MLEHKGQFFEERTALMIGPEVIRKVVNTGLRGVSLAGKLALTLFMGKYLGLADLGIYGLVFAVVTVSSSVLGIRLDYVFARNLVGITPSETARYLRDQVVFYSLNYVIFALAVIAAFFFGLGDAGLLSVIFIIAVFENLCGAMSANLVTLGRPLLSTILFFIRSGLWSLLAVILGFFIPSFRCVESILCFWAVGEAISLLLTFWAWRRLPWRQTFGIPVDWLRIKLAMKTCLPTWLGTIGAMVATSVDRFVVSYFLDLESVGVITFYTSFSAAMIAMVQSGFYAFSYPRMIDYFRKGDRDAFLQEVQKTIMEVAIFVAVVGIILGFVIPSLGGYMGKPELVREAPTLWLMLGAVWLRANADTLYYVLYAQEKDWSLWMGSLLFIVPSTGFNLVLVPMFGVVGAGLSAVIACLLLLFWRIRYVLGPDRKIIF